MTGEPKTQSDDISVEAGDKRQSRIGQSVGQSGLFEQAPGFVCVLNGPEHVFQFVNNAHRRLFNSRDWIGKPARDAFPEIEGQGFFERLDEVFATGQRYVADAAPARFRTAAEGPEEVRFLDFIYEPIFAESGEVTGIFCEGFDVTERVQAQQALGRNQARQDLILKILQGHREAKNPDEILAGAVEALGNFLRADRIGFYDVVGPNQLRFTACWTSGRLTPLTGTWPASNVGEGYLRVLREGRSVSVADVEADPLTIDSQFGQIGIRALIGGPVVRGGAWVGGMYVNQADRRAWAPEEVTLVREVADLTWDAVERARATLALQRNEELLRLATDAGEVGLWSLDIRTGDQLWPSRIRAMFGISDADEVSMDDFYNGLHPDDRDTTIAAQAR